MPIGKRYDADTTKFKGADKAQWEKFRDLPNLFYTDDAQFADAYAQTLTYALLLAQWSGAVELSTVQATKTLRPQHDLLAEALKILADEQTRAEIETPVNVLERVIAAVDPAALARKTPGDPWLYFYEDFLAVYSPKMRKDRGVYYTPVPVVHAQVTLTPQMFRLGRLRDALKAALAGGLLVTDEAAAMEAASFAPRLIEDRADNVKITRPEDLALAEFYLTRRIVG